MVIIHPQPGQPNTKQSMRNSCIFFFLLTIILVIIHYRIYFFTCRFTLISNNLLTICPKSRQGKFPFQNRLWLYFDHVYVYNCTCMIYSMRIYYAHNKPCQFEVGRVQGRSCWQTWWRSGQGCQTVQLSALISISPRYIPKWRWYQITGQIWSLYPRDIFQNYDDTK